MHLEPMNTLQNSNVVILVIRFILCNNSYKTQIFLLGILRDTILETYFKMKKKKTQKPKTKKGTSPGNSSITLQNYQTYLNQQVEINHTALCGLGNGMKICWQ